MLKLLDTAGPSFPPQAQADGPDLGGVFQALDDAGIAYCALHGYENYPQTSGSDIDLLIDRTVTRAQLLRVFRDARERIGGDVVRAYGFHFIVAGAGADGGMRFLDLDMEGSADCDPQDILNNRRRLRQFWIPAQGDEFGAYLARTIAGGRLNILRARRLSALFRQDRFACEVHVRRLWKESSATHILAAAASGDWSLVLKDQQRLRAELRNGVMGKLRDRLGGIGRKLGALWTPDGVNVVVLGPDGAGKSSVIDALEKRLGPVFSGSYCAGFAPSLRRLLGRPGKPTDQPHALPRRSAAVSIIRAGYWFAYNTLGQPYRHVALARSTLILNDRHFLDIFVDSVRYRYGGPRWLLSVVKALSPRPDLVILLDAPTEVLQSRKQEVPFAETERQRKDYRALLKGLGNGHIVNAAQPFDRVVNDASRVILNYMVRRGQYGATLHR